MTTTAVPDAAALAERMRRKITPSTRRAVLDAADGCAYCRSPFADGLEIDHIVPVRQGGSDDLENLAAACWRCNVEKGTRTPDEWQADREAQGKPWPAPSVWHLMAALVAPLDDLLATVAGREDEVGRLVHAHALAVRNGADLDEQRARLVTEIGGGS